MTAHELLRDISILIPTYNAGKDLPDLIALLKSNDAWQVVVIDSSSKDGTAQTLKDHGIEVETISPSEFHHGRTRNTLASRARGKYLVFLTQDALPETQDDILRLVTPIQTGQADACYGRQLPRENAHALEYFQRHMSYPEHSFSSKGVSTGVSHRYFFSNSFSAVSKSKFDELGGFDDRLICNEDMELAYRLITNGGCIEYVSEARCTHSHRHSLRQKIGRYFDVGVFMSSNPDIARHGQHAQGMALAKRSLFSAWPGEIQDNRIHVFLALACSFIGFHLGKRHRSFPQTLCRALSAQKAFWQDP